MDYDDECVAAAYEHTRIRRVAAARGIPIIIIVGIHQRPASRRGVRGNVPDSVVRRYKRKTRGSDRGAVALWCCGWKTKRNAYNILLPCGGDSGDDGGGSRRCWSLLAHSATPTVVPLCHSLRLSHSFFVSHVPDDDDDDRVIIVRLQSKSFRFRVRSSVRRQTLSFSCSCARRADRRLSFSSHPQKTHYVISVSVCRRRENPRRKVVGRACRWRETSWRSVWGYVPRAVRVPPPPARLTRRLSFRPFFPVSFCFFFLPFFFFSPEIFFFRFFSLVSPIVSTTAFLSFARRSRRPLHFGGGGGGDLKAYGRRRRWEFVPDAGWIEKKTPLFQFSRL